MKKKLLRILSFSMSLILFAGLVSCNKTSGETGKASDETTKMEETTKAEESKESSNSESSKGDEESAVYPLEGNPTIKYWVPLNSNVSATYQNLAETPLYQELMKRTGVKLDIQHPSEANANDAFSLLIAGGDYPDVIEFGWLANFSGGPSKAIQDEVLVSHNEILEKYAPNLSKYLAEHADVNKMVQTDNGTYYGFPFVRGDQSLLASQGIFLRSDWLEELGLEIPKTVDDWTKVLTAFKEKKSATAPLTLKLGELQTGHWTNPWGLKIGFYIGNDGKVKYGPAEKEFKGFLEQFAAWYKDGLLDADFATIDNKQVVSKMTSGQAGATLAWMASGMGNMMKAGRETDQKYTLRATPIPVLKEGDPKAFSSKEFPYSGANIAAITSSCENVEAAARFLDYAYSEEGHILMNFGIEGKSFKWEGDYPKYTEEMYNNPNMPLASMLGQYIRANYNGPFVQDARYLEQYQPFEEQVEASKVWADTTAEKTNLPPITATPEESSELAQIMTEISTYVEENYISFILGTKSLDEFDSFVQTIKDMNIDRAIEINNAALERYNNR